MRSMDLFDHHRQRLAATDAPLAARMRPRTLDEFIGQDHIIGPGRLLRRAIAADQISSVIFYGPPGTGKTTLAQIIANATSAHFIAINAVLAGVKDIRGAIAEAQDRQGQYSMRTILFVDEVHRFNKAQQDALLPWVENGTIILIGATTENPYFEVNKALVSRSRLFQLQSLEEADLQRVVDQALSDEERGYGTRPIQLEPDARAHLVNVANGDARALLNALELAVETTPSDDKGQLVITLDVAEESIQRRAVLYDKEGDAHFDTISAFIKSVRGSDPDAALYWLARMVYSGEDPRFIFRRLIILASEDIGLADPQAIGVVTACATAFDRIGMPEGQYPLSQATLYLANAAKSNSTMGFFEALKAVQNERSGDVPNPLKDSNRDKHSFGHGANYKYPHAYRDHWVAEQYLPGGLQGQVFYQPSNQGWEAKLAVQVTQRREAQIAALADGDLALPEVLSFGPVDRGAERWLQRAMGQAGERLGLVRDRMFEQANCQRHHVVLDLNAGSGLFTWEAIRQVPEGGVYAQVRSEAEAQQLQTQSQSLPDLLRPVPLYLSGLFGGEGRGEEGTASMLKFDRIMGRNGIAEGIAQGMMPELWVKQLCDRLRPQGRIILAEQCPQMSQRLSAWLSEQGLPKRPKYQKLLKQLQIAEKSMYETFPELSWGPKTARQWFEETQLQTTVTLERTSVSIALTSDLIARWFDERPVSYGSRLGSQLSSEAVLQVQQMFMETLSGQTRELKGAIVWIVAQSQSQR